MATQIILLFHGIKALTKNIKENGIKILKRKEQYFIEMGIFTQENPKN